MTKYTVENLIYEYLNDETPDNFGVASSTILFKLYDLDPDQKRKILDFTIAEAFSGRVLLIKLRRLFQIFVRADFDMGNTINQVLTELVECMCYRIDEAEFMMDALIRKCKIFNYEKVLFNCLNLKLYDTFVKVVNSHGKLPRFFKQYLYEIKAAHLLKKIKIPVKNISKINVDFSKLSL